MTNPAIATTTRRLSEVAERLDLLRRILEDAREGMARPREYDPPPTGTRPDFIYELRHKGDAVWQVRVGNGKEYPAERPPQRIDHHARASWARREIRELEREESALKQALHRLK